MSGNLGEPQSANLQSPAAPRKRPRQDSACDIDSGIGDSEGGSGSVSVSSESGEAEDGRQGGSQKRARSEGHGDQDVSHSSGIWPRSGGSRGTSNYPSPVHFPATSSSSSASSSSIGSSRYLSSDRSMRESSPESSFIPLPAASVARNLREDALDSPDPGSSNRLISNAAQDVFNRSMAFDEQMDILRRSPSIPASPVTVGTSSLSVIAPSEDRMASEPIDPQSPLEDASLGSAGELDASEPEPRVESAVHQPTSSGRLHALADTASMHSRLFPAPPGLAARSGVPSLPPVHLPFSINPTSSTVSNGSSVTMPPSRMRLFRQQEQGRLQPRSASHPSPPQVDPVNGRELQLSAPNVAPSQSLSRDAEEMAPSFPRRAPAPSLSYRDLSLPPIAGPPQPLDTSIYTSPVRHHHTLSRSNFSHEMRDPFEPFEPFAPRERPFPAFDTYDSLDALSARRIRRQSTADSPPTVGGHVENQRPIGYRRNMAGVFQTTLPSRTEEINPPIAIESRPRGAPRGMASDTESRDAATGRSAPVERSQDSFWAGMFDDLDSERDGSPRRPAPTFDMAREDVRRRTTDADRDATFRRPTPDYDALRENVRRRNSLWDWGRRPGSVSDNEHYSTTASSSSSMSSRARSRSMSRSLLDPSLRFGGPSVTDPRSPSGLETNRPRHDSRARLLPWFDEMNGDDEEDLLDLGNPTFRRERMRDEGLSPFSSFFSSMDSMERNEDPPLPAFRRTSNLRNSPAHSDSPWTRAVSGRAPSFPSRSSVYPTYGIERALDNATDSPQSNPAGFWEDDFTAPGSSNHRIMRRDGLSTLSGTRYRQPMSTPGDSSRPLSAFGPREQPSSGLSTLHRLGRPAETTAQGHSSSVTAESMEDIIPESNARESDSMTTTFGRHQSPSPFLPNIQSTQAIDPPPRPVEPRLSSWDVGPRPNVRIGPRRFRPPSPSEFPSLFPPDQDSPDAVHSTSATPARSQRVTDTASQPPLDQPHVSNISDQFLAHRQVSGVDGNQDNITSAGISLSSPRFPPVPSDHSSLWRPPSPPRRSGVGGLRVATETFSELIRRRAARAEAQSRAARRSPSPDSTFRPSYRLPRPSFLLDGDDGHERAARLERRNSATLSGQPIPTESSSANDESATSRLGRLELERQHAAHLLERSVNTRYSTGTSASRYQDYLANTRADRERTMGFGRQQPSEDGERNDHQAMATRARTFERLERRGSASSNVGSRFMDLFGPPAEGRNNPGGSRERQQVHEAIGRHSRDDEDATRRSLPHMDRPRPLLPRDPLSDETSRTIQRRLRESEAEVGRALRALDQWGELEGSGELDPAHSRMHRFGETLRRRRAPPAFNFGGTSMDHDSTPGTGSSSTTRPGRRSPSPTSAATRLQNRQARFARAQGRFRELGADIFGESRSRSSRLDMLGGSRFASRYITRGLGDYMRDEDFDASYENLVRLAAVVGDAKPRGTPAHLLAAMPTGFYKDFTTPGCETRCPICLDDYKELDPVLRISDCEHWFHKECLEQWLQGARSCPVCRRRVRGRGRGQQSPPDDAPGPSGSRRDDGSDDDGPGGGSGGGGGGGSLRMSPSLTLAELGSFAEGW